MTDRNDGTGPLSSEELIRRARAEYESPDPEPSGEMGESKDPWASPADTSRVTRSDPMARPAAAETGYARPADYLKTEYQDQVGTSSATPPGGAISYESRRPSFFSRFGGLMVGGLVVLGVIGFAMFDKTKGIDELEIGDCLRVPENEIIEDVESADCAAEHELEVFANVTLPDADGVPYPGEDDVVNRILDQCFERFAPYVGVAWLDSVWDFNAIYPTQDGWENQDDRAGTCVLLQPGPDLEPLTITGSARGANQ